MRYAQGGGLTDERRAFREKLRMEAAERFRQGDETPVMLTTCGSASVGTAVAQGLVTERTQSSGVQGPASLPLLSDELFAVLERELAKGPVAHDWPDQTWTCRGSRR
ncbi:hypothetical protein ACIRXG_28435 [Streptomyces wuyuanensis]|uniref:hypothetical protein n=1 Tax=Streptomyces wuyuanensis TaxID=1196353 RepID=UPI003824D098